MPVKVVVDLPRPHAARALSQGIRALFGGLLVLVGLLASIAAFPLTILFFLSVAIPLVARGDTAAGAPAGLITFAWSIASAITIFGLVVGLRLLRGQRELVLFLRRFGYTEATEAVTFAVVKTVGRSWRLVTLDDSTIAPLGLPIGTRRLFRAGSLGSASIAGALRMVYAAVKLGPLALGGMLAILGLAAWLNQDLNTFLDFPHSGEPIGLHSFPRPGEHSGWNLQGAFYALFVLFTVALVLGVLLIPLYLLVLPLALVLGFSSSAAEAARKAEESRRGEIATVAQIETVAESVEAESHKIFAPRLVVLRVVSHVWKQAVQRLAASASTALIDVSKPSENLLWEIQELTGGLGAKCVFVGQYDRVSRLSENAEEAPSPLSIDGRLAALLEGEEVLAYTSGRRGMKRFARALRNKLQALSLADPDEACHSPIVH